MYGDPLVLHWLYAHLLVRDANGSRRRYCFRLTSGSRSIPGAKLVPCLNLLDLISTVRIVCRCCCSFTRLSSNNNNNNNK